MKVGDKAVDIDAQTRLCLLLGNPVSHSLSPFIFNAGFQALKLNYIYLASLVDESKLGPAVKGLKALSIAGANVTSPYKEKVIPYLDSLAEEAGKIRSVNTIINRNGALFGTSTDGRGFLNSLKQSDPGYKLGQSVMIIGAGGAARAVAHALAQNGVGEIYIVNRSFDKGQALADLIKSHTALKNCSAFPLTIKSIQTLLPLCRLFIYCLPADSPEFLAALDNSGLSLQQNLLYDLRYKPRETAVMSAVAQAGGKVCNGLGMLFWQAVIAFELFTGQKAPVAEMQKALDKTLKLER